MATIDDIFDAVQDTRYYLETLPGKLLLRADQIFIIGGLSDIDGNLGIVTAGEFRAGNVKDPGKSFSGTRMAYPGMSYPISTDANAKWHLAGVFEDTIQFGVDALTGKLIAGGGSVVLDSDGISAIGGTIAGWEIHEDYLLSPGTPGIQIDSTGSIGTTNFSSGINGTGWRISETGEAEFSNAFIRGELRSSVLTYQEVHSVSGTEGIFVASGVLLEDCTIPATGSAVVKIKDPAIGHTQLFNVGHIMWIKSGAVSTWLTVSGVTDNTTYYSYTCSISNGSTSVTYTAGQAVVNYGASGQGFILLDAIGTGTPKISINTHAGAPWTTSTEHVRIGNLASWQGAGLTGYGLAVGDYSGTEYMAYSPGGGLVIRGTIRADDGFLGTLDVTGKLSLSTAGAALSVGTTPPASKTSGTGIWFDRTGFYTVKSNTPVITLDAASGNLLTAYSASGSGYSIELGNDGLHFNYFSDTYTASVVGWYTDGDRNAVIYGAADGDGSFFMVSSQRGDATVGDSTVVDIRATDNEDGGKTAGILLNSTHGVGTYISFNADSLRFSANSVSGYIFMPLTTPLTSTSWDGDARSTTSPTLIDLSDVFGVPAGVRAVLVRLACRDSAAVGTTGLSIGVGPSSTYFYNVSSAAHGGDLVTSQTALCNCDANGDIYYRIAASGADTMDVWLEIWGYFK